MAEQGGRVAGMELIDRLVPIKSIANNDDKVFALDAVRLVADRVIDLPRDGKLAVASSGGWVSFVVLGFAYSETDATGVHMVHIFHGDGPGGAKGEALRELRHTYWGEADNSGYIFYPSGALITAALEALEEWFDVE